MAGLKGRKVVIGDRGILGTEIREKGVCTTGTASLCTFTIVQPIDPARRQLKIAKA